MMNSLLRLKDLGQSVWLDYLDRSLLLTGELKRLIRDDGISGLTSNPSILNMAVASGAEYDETISQLSLAGLATPQIYDAIAVEDLQRAADIFRPVYDLSQGEDGYISLEVPPRLAWDPVQTVEEAHRLWKALFRPNVMIKVPATKEGIEAVRQLTSDGINVNATLLFGVPRYREVATAFVEGLEERAARGEANSTMASAASFFLSRIDLLVDPMLALKEANGGEAGKVAASLKGKVAIANAQAAYGVYQQVFQSPRFLRLGARPQRLLWASTSTKRAYESDVKYVEPLIGPSTLNTMTRETMAAYKEHGDPTVRLKPGDNTGQRVLEALNEIGIDPVVVATQLEHEGVRKFAAAFDELMLRIENKRRLADTQRVW